MVIPVNSGDEWFRLDTVHHPIFRCTRFEACSHFFRCAQQMEGKAHTLLRPCVNFMVVSTSQPQQLTCPERTVPAGSGFGTPPRHISKQLTDSRRELLVF